MPLNGTFLLLRWVLGSSHFQKPHCYGGSSVVTTSFLTPCMQWTVGETDTQHPVPVTSDEWPQVYDIMDGWQLVEDLDTFPHQHSFRSELSGRLNDNSLIFSFPLPRNLLGLYCYSRRYVHLRLTCSLWQHLAQAVSEGCIKLWG